MESIRPTRFPELGYRKDGPSLWRIYADMESAVGPFYRTKVELLGDLERYAHFYGCADALNSNETATYYAAR